MGGAGAAAADAHGLYFGYAFPPAPERPPPPLAFLPRLPPPRAEGGYWGKEGAFDGFDAMDGEDGDAGAHADLDGLQELDPGVASQEVRSFRRSASARG
jgi:hypothetical protein